MDKARRCEQCGSPVLAGAPGGICPQCLMLSGLRPLRSKESPGSLPQIGRYKIIRLIGRGGMGAVYAAEQEQPRRIVALKVMSSGVTTRRSVRRFSQEAEALGRL